MADPVVAWHFCAADRKLKYGDGRKIKKGAVFTVKAPPLMCAYGLHASVSALDALYYAPGCHVSRVVLDGDIVWGTDKAVASVREHLVVADAQAVISEFAWWCADRAKNTAAFGINGAWLTRVAANGIVATNVAHAARCSNAAVTAAVHAATLALYAGRTQRDWRLVDAAAASERQAQEDWLHTKLFELIQSTGEV